MLSDSLVHHIVQHEIVEAQLVVEDSIESAEFEVVLFWPLVVPVVVVSIIVGEEKVG